MKKILIYSYYIDPNNLRRKEINHVLEKNFSAGFDYIFIHSEASIEEIKNQIDFNTLSPHTQLIIGLISQRPTFNSLFKTAEHKILKDIKDKLLFVANSDIYFDKLQEYERIYKVFQHKEKIALALSRWDIQEDGSSQFVDRLDSQDAYVFYGDIEFRLKKDFCMGVPGCDNRLVYDLIEAGYNVLNPSLNLKIYHYHISDVRRYMGEGEVHKPFLGNEKQRIDGPYAILPVLDIRKHDG